MKFQIPLSSKEPYSSIDLNAAVQEVSDIIQCDDTILISPLASANFVVKQKK